MKIYWIILLVVVACFFFVSESRGQDWRKIVPLKSKCKDIKRILGVTKCEFPVSRYEFPKFKVTVEFRSRYIRRNVSRDTVVLVTIILKEMIPLKDIGYDITEFEVKLVSSPRLLPQLERKCFC